jgi:alkanesulfonate monooxygenase SsuD/methylene tetrahydromethanopterin reductase-like flavin-dependent oxidoreductase (luciferase family)
VCDAVEGRFLDQLDIAALRAAVVRAETDGIDAVFFTNSAMGDAIVLAAAMAAGMAAGVAAGLAPGILLGVRISLGDHPHRHPTVLAREMTTLDHVTAGRSVLAFAAPFSDATAEAITLCREMWRTGIATSEGPHYPVAGAINRPLPARPGGPPIALDLTAGAPPDATLVRRCDLVLVPAGASPPPGLPAGIDVCRMQGA